MRMNKDLSTMYDDLFFQVKAQLSAEDLASSVTAAKLRWTENFLYSKKACLEDISRALEVLTTLGDDEYLVEYFSVLTILRDPKGTRP